MYEDNERFSWTNLFIKIIIIIIFVLFTIWLLSLSTKNVVKPMSNSINVLTDNIFSQNVDRMKEVGKDYFTTERLPQKVGETKTISLAKMYDENLILEVKDKNGNACSAKNSYVSVEKMESEYQMKVYLECGEEHDFVKVVMGCYNYCNTDICEKKEEPVNNKQIEYQYSKTTGGAWTNYGSWSQWSKNVVTKTNYRDVETKKVKETYTYDKTVIDSEYVGEAICPIVDGYTLKSMDDGKCIYTKNGKVVSDPERCPSRTNDGYVLVSQDGFTCKYSKGTQQTVSPVTCPSKSGDYDLVSQNGFTCNYSKTTKTNVNPLTCPSTSGDYNLASQNGLTCNYSKTVNESVGASQVQTGGGSHQECHQVPVGVKTVTPCSGCGVQVITVYDTQCYTVNDPATYSYTCPDSSWKLSGHTCTRTGTATKTESAGCPSGSTASGNNCVKTTVDTKTTTVGCPEGSQKVDNSCVKTTTDNKTVTASCPSGYERKDDKCEKNTTVYVTKAPICVGDEKMHDGKCYNETSRIEKVTDVRTVTYYRYRTREYKGGTVDYKWSLSKNDAALIKAGYKLTGKTREVVGGK